MKMHTDFVDLLKLFNAHQVEYMVVGAYAVMHYSEPRYTKDMDVWVNTTPENARRVYAALAEFGAPLRNITAQDFMEPNVFYQVGVEPIRIDVITTIKPLDFSVAWVRKETSEYEPGLTTYFVSLDDLLLAKQAVGRAHDLADIKRLLKPKKSPRKTRGE